MAWRSAFLAQAQSDYSIFERLNDPSVEYCHRLHYLQMVTEKLSKAILSDDRESPEFTHSIFVIMLQSLKGRPDLRRKLGYRDARIFRNYINSLLSVAARIERLAPSVAGGDKPNPEYPWIDVASGEIIAPAHFEFADFNPRETTMQKLLALVRELLRFPV